MKLRAAILLPLLALSSGFGDAAELTPEETKFFEEKIRPVLVENCYRCHSSGEKIKGGLSLDTKDGVLLGGDSGPALVAGDPDKSLLYTTTSYTDPDFEMPPKERLSSEAVADIKRWIEMGAPDPRVTEISVVRSEIDIEKGREFWSFQHPEKADPPAVKNADWAKSNVDRFVLAKLEGAKLSPAADAKGDDLLRRLHFDLIGMPPLVHEIKKFAAAWKKDPEAAYKAKVDELLASERFGERWGRHWLDVARYAESTGMDVNMSFPNAWRYRDYVIDSFNKDKPYDRFVKEQIAGDLLPAKTDAEWQENLIATGFLAVGPKSLIERNPRQFTLDVADEQIDATTQAILGLTVSCARCHDHKTDPIPTTDYYAMSGIFQNTMTHFGTINTVQARRATKLIELPLSDTPTMLENSPEELAQLKARLAGLEGQREEMIMENRRARMSGETAGNNIQQVIRLRSQTSVFQARVNSYDEAGNPIPFGMGVQEKAEIVDVNVLVRGDVNKPAQTVPRGFVQVIDIPESGETIPDSASGRRQLADWLSSPENPLTARVMVNRVWSNLFGQGLVTSHDNFGATGQLPSHPELLDTLAVEFAENGWSVKDLIRDLVNTRTYRMSADFDSAAYSQDPDNTLLWRRSPERLDAESLRDAMLTASGRLDTERPLGSIIGELGDAAIAQRAGSDVVNRAVNYRSVFLPIVRDGLPEALDLFDAADPNRVAGDRDETNVPGQSLYLMNNSFVLNQSKALADRLLEKTDDSSARITEAFLACYSRVPNRAEMAASQKFLSGFAAGDEGNPDRLALATFCQSLLASAEFRYLN